VRDATLAYAFHFQQALAWVAGAPRPADADTNTPSPYAASRSDERLLKPSDAEPRDAARGSYPDLWTDHGGEA